MTKHPILEKAKRDSKEWQQVYAIILIVVCAIFALNYKYVVISCLGPYKASEIDLENPGLARFIEAEGEFFEIGSKGMDLKAFGVEVDSGIEIGEYYVHPIGDKLLIVYVDGEVEGKMVGGKLEKMPQNLRSQLGDSDQYYSHILNSYVNYRSSANLFMLIAMLLFPFVLFLYLKSLLVGGNVTKHKQIKKLKKYGDPLSIVADLEEEILLNHKNTDELLIHASAEWLVLFENTLGIFRQDEVVGFGVVQKSPRAELSVFVKGQSVHSLFMTTSEQAIVMLKRAVEIAPEKLIRNVEAYEKVWDPKNPQLPQG